MKRSCCMSNTLLHLDTLTDKLAFENSKHWYLPQHQNFVSDRLKCSWCSSLDWLPTTMIKIRQQSEKFNDSCIQKWCLGQHCHTSRNSVCLYLPGAQLYILSPYFGYTLGGPITWLAEKLCKENYELWTDGYLRILANANVADIPCFAILSGKSNHFGHPKFS